jgi:hypothetical protein
MILQSDAPSILRRHLHRDNFGNADTYHIAYSRPAQVVRSDSLTLAQLFVAVF